MDYTKLFDLSGRVAVVIGGGSGIGQSVAKGLAAHGAFVICADSQLEAAGETVRQICDRAKAMTVDIKKSDSVAKLFGSIVAQHQWMEVVVTTPGTNVRKPISNYEDSEFDSVIELNLKGTFRVLREAGRIMSGQGYGSIIAFSSIRSIVVEPGQGVYA